MLSDLERYRSVRETEEALAQVHKDRAEAVRVAISSGARVSQVARALGISSQRVTQIVKGGS